MSRRRGMLAAFAAAIAGCSATGLVGTIADGGVSGDDASTDDATVDHRDATTDVASDDANVRDVIGDAGRDADAARCRYEGDACVACECPPLYGSRIHDFDDGGACYESTVEFISCWDGYGPGNGCGLTAAFTGLCRDEADGSTSQFELPGGPAGTAGSIVDPDVHGCAVRPAGLAVTCE